MKHSLKGSIVACCLLSGAWAFGEGVKYRGIFINDEDWSFRPWAIKHFGKTEQIGTNAYREVFRLMKEDGLNLLWPAMHEGGYEFSARPENLALAKASGIAIGTSHCEPMLRNNCYIPKKDRGLWSWTNHRDFVEDYWREGVRRGKDNEVLWTIGMRGIHDGGMKDGKTRAEKIAIMESVFAFQTNLLAQEIKKAPTLFCPYKEVLPLYNAGLKVPDDTVIMWVNDNFGYVRRIGGNDKPQGIYWHLSYHGSPHGYIHLCTTPPAFLWYELVAKCWNNGVRDVWMVNAGDVFQAELLLYCYGRMAAAPDACGADSQEKLLAQFIRERLQVKDEALTARIVAHLNEYFTLGFIRKPEHMCVHWTLNLPPTVKSELLARYQAFLAEDLAIEKELSLIPHTSSLIPHSSSLIPQTYFRLIGFQAQFLAHAGVIHLSGKDADYAYSVYNPLYARWDKLEGGKWSGFWCDTVNEHGGRRQKSTVNRWSTQMQWAWNEPDAKAQYHGTPRRQYPATAYRADVPEPTWLEPVVNAPAKDGAWTRVTGLGTSGRALALLPVKPGVGVGAALAYDLPAQAAESLVLQFLPDYALWPGLKLGVNVQFDDGKPVYVAVPKSDSNIGEKDVVRNQAVQDNFIRVPVKIPAGAKRVTVIATDAGVVLDRVGVSSAATDPKVVGRRIVEQFLRTRPESYCPPGYRGNGYNDTGYGRGTSVQYSVVSLWANGLAFARQTGDAALEERLVRLYDDFLPGGKLNGVCSRPYHVDDAIFGAVPLEIFLRSRDGRYLAEGLRYADTQWTPPCAGSLETRHALPKAEQEDFWKRGYTPQTRLWIDDMYMITALQSQAYRATGDRKYIERAAYEMCLYLDKLQLKDGPAKGLFYHAPDVPFVWGRGDGWMAAGMALVLRHLPADSVHRARILAGYREMMAALLKYQRPDGMWSQLVNEPDDPANWPESSCTGMFAYAFITGVRQGWLDAATYEAPARKAWIALCNSLDEYGNVPQTCCGTGKRNDHQYYFARTRVHGDPHGQAPILWCANALLEKGR